MKLLICTQVVDKDHPILGFFHRWIEEFAKHCEEVHVICLQKGEYSLPVNVHVYSLGKEEGSSKIKYLLRFYSLIWKLRGDYDNVFVHMNQIYVIAGALLWKGLNKKIGLWYMHKSVTLSLRVAEKLLDTVFTGSSESFRLQSKKIIVTGHGIDTDHFIPQAVQKDTDLVTVGRIARSKNLHTLINIFSKIYKHRSVTLTIVGNPMTTDEEQYKNELISMIKALHLSEAVVFSGAVTQTNLPKILQQAKVFVHTAQNGSLDKSILEALACALPVVTMAPGASSLPLGDWHVANEADFVAQVLAVLESGASEKKESLRKFVGDTHSLQALVPNILNNY